MKNLELLELVHSFTGDFFANVELFTQTLDSIYFIGNNVLYKFDLTTKTRAELCPVFYEQLISLKFLTIENKVCVVTNENLHIVDPDGTKEVQILDFPNEISAISWNPTEELVAIVSPKGEVLTFNIDYENCELYPQGQSSINAIIPDTVYVGWGSKHTQFRGSEGKLKKLQPVEVEPVLDEKPAISWRGNGEMFVVNYWVDKKRQFVVFETPCKALYRSEECLGLQSPVAWRPMGNMIATLAQTSTKQIVIFEKNGQKRFSFDINFGDVRIKGIKWSPCAQILTIHSENCQTDAQSVHLLMASNYKWYEKQVLTFSTENPLLDFDWLETNHSIFTLRAITKKNIVKYTFRSVVARDSSGICAVIDGKTLQLTDFSDAVVPPIMCSKKLTNDSPINFVTLRNDIILIVDANNRLKLLELGKHDPIFNLDLGEKVNDLSRFPLACHHFLIEGIIYFCAERENETVFYSLDFKSGNLNFIHTATDCVRHLIFCQNDIIDIYGFKQIGNCLLMNDNDSKSIYQSVKIIDNKSYVCQLTATCHFYVNDSKISDCVNSFVIFDKYLLYTTKTNELYCLRFTEVSLDGGSEKKYRRNIEQGASIVSAVPNSSKIVLQLPRGNLETISCRLISIDILDRLLESGKWEEAVRFIRLEKLNANLLFDLNSDRFLGQIDRFIEGVKTINELNAVCLEFEQNNVLTTIYKNWGKCDSYPGKIDKIFGEILKYFDSVDYATYISTIMIINLNFYTLKDALVYLQDLLRRSYDDSSLKQKLIDAVTTLKTYGCDQEKLYSEALLLYDLDLAHFVATCCQLDPRVYEPHLNNLKNLTEVERRYEINVFGKNPKVGVAYLVRCPKIESEEVTDFIKNHNVGREAYEFCPRNNRHFPVVSRLFAQELSRRGCHQEAGVILKRAGLLEEALKEFKLSLEWREVLNLLAELQVGEVKKLQTIDEIGKKLLQSGKAKDAAILYELYGGHYEMAIKILINHDLFEEAIHVAKKYNRRDIIVSEIIPGLSKHKYYLELRLNHVNVGFYESCKTRLAEVRRNKGEKFSCGYDDNGRDDLFSDAGSTVTRSSRSSRSRSSSASSRNRKKEEKKKRDLRRGGIYEDIALIRTLHQLIKEIFEMGEKVRSACLLLLQESDVPYSEVKKLYELYLKTEADVKNGFSEIWPPHFYANNPTQNVQELADLENFEHLDVEFRTPPSGGGACKLNLF